MALFIPWEDGNACVVLGGRWNDPGNPETWDNRLQGATEFQFTVTFKPDPFYTDLPSGAYNNGLGTAITGLAGGSTSGRSYELALYIDGGYGAVVLRVWGDNGLSLIELSAHDALVPGRLNRLVGQWRARGDYLALWNNGIRLPGSVNGSIASINSSSNQPLEIGAQSHSDTRATAGEYSEFAIWTKCHDDAAAKAYGSGVSPNYLPNRGRWKYVTLERLESTDLPLPGDLYKTGHIHDEWQGDWPNNRLEYGAPLTTYNFGGGDFQRSRTGVVWYPANPSGEIHEVPHPVVWGGISAILPDSELLPKRDLECGELDGTSIGKRSGVTWLVPSGFTLQAALSGAQPGDDIVIDASLPQEATNNQPWRGPNISAWPTTAGTPRMPPEHQWGLDAQETLVGTVAPVGTVTPDCAGMDHAYVLITSSRVSNLPAPNVKRVIPLPNGEIRRVMHESGLLNSSQLTHCATLLMAPVGTPILDFSSAPGDYPQGRMHFRGINFRQSDVGGAALVMHLGCNNFSDYRWNMYDNREMLPPPKNIVLNQCAFSFDPLDNGEVIAQIAQADAVALGVVNCLGLNLFGSSGDQKLFGMSLGVCGPWHYENNDMQACNMFWLTGGQASPFVNVGPNNVTVRRNWLHAPKHWPPSEPNPQREIGWRVNIHPFSAARSQVDLVVGLGGWFQRTSPKMGCIMYRPATGRAMHLNQDHVASALGGVTTTVYLEALWPEGTVNNATVGFQWISTDPESTPTLYNSGLETVMPTAAFTAGSRHVVLSAPIPQVVVDRLAAGDRLYIYPNTTSWCGENESIPGTWSPPATHNGWSGRQGITRAQARRKQIVSIATDGLSLETDPTQNAYPDSITFPYSIVRFDGLFRSAFHHFKGSWENKNGAYWLQEGNIFNLTSNRLYVAGNNITGSQGPIGGRVQISGNDVTLLDADWPTNISDITKFRMRYGAPGLFPYLVFGGFDIERPGLTRVVTEITGLRTGRLLGPDPRNPDRFMGDGTYSSDSVGWQTNSIPWMYIFAQVMRYNIWERGSGPIVQPEMHIGHAIPGGHMSFHDMLILRSGDRSEPNSDGAEGLLARMVQYNDPTIPVTQSPYVYAPGGGATYDEPPPTGANGKTAFTHYSIVRPDGNATAILGGGHRQTVAADKKAVRLTYSENIIVAGDGTIAPYQVEVAGNSEMADPSALYDAATTRSQRNVFVGSALAQATARYAPRDNTGVLDPASIGFAAYANGAIDGYNLENYRLADIYTAGTVTLAADYTTVTLDTGTFPAAVSSGQFFRISPMPMLVKIRAAGSGLGASWNTYAGQGVFVKRSGRASRQVGDGFLQATQTHTQALPGDQWGQVTLTGVPLDSPANTFFDLLIRFTAPDTLSGYRVRCLDDGANPTTKNLLLLERVDAGSSAAVGALLSVDPFAANDVLLWEMVGTTFTITRNGGLLASWGGDGTYAGGRVGCAIRSASNQFSNFSCGDYGGAGGSRRTLASDAFTGGDGTLLLDSRYPVSPGSGKSYAVTFKNSGTDGRDPGVDIDTLALMVQGVGTATAVIVEPGPSISPPFISGTPYHQGDTVVTGIGQAGGTATLFRNGVAGTPQPIDGAGHWTVTVTPLSTGEVLTATQSDGVLTSLPSPPTTVLALTPPVAPAITGTPYHAGDTSVSGTGLVGATVTLLVNGVSGGSTTVSGSGIWVKPVPALVAGDTLTATQTTGSGTSVPSGSTTVLAAVGPPPPVGTTGHLLLAPLTTGALLLSTGDALLVTGGDRLGLSISSRLLLTQPGASGVLLVTGGDTLELTTTDHLGLAGPGFVGGSSTDLLLLQNLEAIPPSTPPSGGPLNPRTNQSGVGRLGSRQAR